MAFTDCRPERPKGRDKSEYQKKVRHSRTVNWRGRDKSEIARGSGKARGTHGLSSKDRKTSQGTKREREARDCRGTSQNIKRQRDSEGAKTAVVAL